MTLSMKLALVAEMQALLAERDGIASQTNLPDAIRNGVVAEISARLTEIEQELT
jgi:predicted metal-binding protein